MIFPKLFKKAYITIVGLLFYAQLAYSQIKIDTTAIPVFWEIADTLSLDQDPSKQLWAKFSNHPAYDQIQKQGNRTTFLKKTLPIVFKPSKKSKLNALIHGKESIYKDLAIHFIEVKSRRQELSNYIMTLDFDKILQVAPKKSMNYLPADVVNTNIDITIFIALFEKDNGFGGKSITLDPLTFISGDDEDLINFVAHEFHHSLRTKSKLFRPFPTDSKYFPILQALHKLPLEGVASILDNDKHFNPQYLEKLKKEKPSLIALNNEFRNLVGEAPTNLQEIDSILRQANEEKITIEETRDQIFEQLPWGGHTVGFYMSKAIEKKLGKEQLIAVQYSPINFMLAYHKASMMDQTIYKFSNESIAFIQNMD